MDDLFDDVSLGLLQGDDDKVDTALGIPPLVRKPIDPVAALISKNRRTLMGVDTTTGAIPASPDEEWQATRRKYGISWDAPPKDEGFMKESGKALARGVVSIPEMFTEATTWGQKKLGMEDNKLNEWASSITEWSKGIQENTWMKKGSDLSWGTEQFVQAFEMVGQQVPIILVSSLAGGPILGAIGAATKAGKAGKVATTAYNVAAGGTMAGLFGASTAQKDYDQAIREGKTPQEAEAYGSVTGFHEYAWEQATLPFEMAAGPIGRLLIHPTVTTLKAAMGSGWKTLAASAASIAALEIPSEMATSYFQQKAANEYEVGSPGDPRRAAMAAIAPTAIFSTLLGLGMHHIDVRQRKSLINAITQPVVMDDEGNFDPRAMQARVNAVNYMVDELQNKDPQLAEEFGYAAGFFIKANAPINIDEKFTGIVTQYQTDRAKAIADLYKVTTSSADSMAKGLAATTIGNWTTKTQADTFNHLVKMSSIANALETDEKRMIDAAYPNLSGEITQLRNEMRAAMTSKNWDFLTPQRLAEIQELSKEFPEATQGAFIQIVQQEQQYKKDVEAGGDVRGLGTVTTVGEKVAGSENLKFPKQHAMKIHQIGHVIGPKGPLGADIKLLLSRGIQDDADILGHLKEIRGKNAKVGKYTAIPDSFLMNGIKHWKQVHGVDIVAEQSKSIKPLIDEAIVTVGSRDPGVIANYIQQHPDYAKTSRSVIESMVKAELTLEAVTPEVVEGKPAESQKLLPAPQKLLTAGQTPANTLDTARLGGKVPGMEKYGTATGLNQTMQAEPTKQKLLPAPEPASPVKEGTKKQTPARETLDKQKLLKNIGRINADISQVEGVISTLKKEPSIGPKQTQLQDHVALLARLKEAKDRLQNPQKYARIEAAKKEAAKVVAPAPAKVEAKPAKAKVVKEAAPKVVAKAEKKPTKTVATQEVAPAKTVTKKVTPVAAKNKSMFDEVFGEVFGGIGKEPAVPVATKPAAPVVVSKKSKAAKVGKPAPVAKETDDQPRTRTGKKEFRGWLTEKGVDLASEKFKSLTKEEKAILADKYQAYLHEGVVSKPAAKVETKPTKTAKPAKPVSKPAVKKTAAAARPAATVVAPVVTPAKPTGKVLTFNQWCAENEYPDPESEKYDELPQKEQDKISDAYLKYVGELKKSAKQESAKGTAPKVEFTYPEGITPEEQGKFKAFLKEFGNKGLLSQFNTAMTGNPQVEFLDPKNLKYRELYEQYRLNTPSTTGHAASVLVNTIIGKGLGFGATPKGEWKAIKIAFNDVWDSAKRDATNLKDAIRIWMLKLKEQLKVVSVSDRDKIEPHMRRFYNEVIAKEKEFVARPKTTKAAKPVPEVFDPVGFKQGVLTHLTDLIQVTKESKSKKSMELTQQYIELHNYLVKAKPEDFSKVLALHLISKITPEMKQWEKNAVLAPFVQEDTPLFKIFIGGANRSPEAMKLLKETNEKLYSVAKKQGGLIDMSKISMEMKSSGRLKARKISGRNIEYWAERNANEGKDKSEWYVGYTVLPSVEGEGDAARFTAKIFDPSGKEITEDANGDHVVLEEKSGWTLAKKAKAIIDGIMVTHETGDEASKKYEAIKIDKEVLERYESEARKAELSDLLEDISFSPKTTKGQLDRWVNAKFFEYYGTDQFKEAVNDIGDAVYTELTQLKKEYGYTGVAWSDREILKKHYRKLRDGKYEQAEGTAFKAALNVGGRKLRQDKANTLLQAKLVALENLAIERGVITEDSRGRWSSPWNFERSKEPAEFNPSREWIGFETEKEARDFVAAREKWAERENTKITTSVTKQELAAGTRAPSERELGERDEFGRLVYPKLEHSKKGLTSKIGKEHPTADILPWKAEILYEKGVTIPGWMPAKDRPTNPTLLKIWQIESEISPKTGVYAEGTTFNMLRKLGWSEEQIKKAFKDSSTYARDARVIVSAKQHYTYEAWIAKRAKEANKRREDAKMKWRIPSVLQEDTAQVLAVNEKNQLVDGPFVYTVVKRPGWLEPSAQQLIESEIIVHDNKSIELARDYSKHQVDSISYYDTPGKSRAVINGQEVKDGDRIDGVLVKKINPDSVTLNYDNQDKKVVKGEPVTFKQLRAAPVHGVNITIINRMPMATYTTVHGVFAYHQPTNTWFQMTTDPEAKAKPIIHVWTGDAKDNQVALELVNYGHSPEQVRESVKASDLKSKQKNDIITSLMTKLDNAQTPIQFPEQWFLDRVIYHLEERRDAHSGKKERGMYTGLLHKLRNESAEALFKRPLFLDQLNNAVPLPRKYIVKMARLLARETEVNLNVSSKAYVPFSTTEPIYSMTYDAILKTIDTGTQIGSVKVVSEGGRKMLYMRYSQGKNDRVMPVSTLFSHIDYKVFINAKGVKDGVIPFELLMQAFAPKTEGMKAATLAKKEAALNTLRNTYVAIDSKGYGRFIKTGVLSNFVLLRNMPGTAESPSNLCVVFEFDNHVSEFSFIAASAKRGVLNKEYLEKMGYPAELVNAAGEWTKGFWGEEQSERGEIEAASAKAIESDEFENTQREQEDSNDYGKGAASLNDSETMVKLKRQAERQGLEPGNFSVGDGWTNLAKRHEIFSAKVNDPEKGWFAEIRRVNPSVQFHVLRNADSTSLLRNESTDHKNSIRGFFYKDQNGINHCFVFTDNLLTPKDGHLVYLHELTHAGLRNVFGIYQTDRAMKNLLLRVEETIKKGKNESARKRYEEIRAYYENRKNEEGKGFSEESLKFQALQEVLVEIGSDKTVISKQGFLQHIKAFWNRVLNVFGVPSTLTETEMVEICRAARSSLLDMGNANHIMLYGKSLNKGQAVEAENRADFETSVDAVAQGIRINPPPKGMTYFTAVLNLNQDVAEKLKMGESIKAQVTYVDSSTMDRPAGHNDSYESVVVLGVTPDKVKVGNSTFTTIDSNNVLAYAYQGNAYASSEALVDSPTFRNKDYEDLPIDKSSINKHLKSIVKERGLFESLNAMERDRFQSLFYLNDKQFAVLKAEGIIVSDGYNAQWNIETMTQQYKNEGAEMDAPLEYSFDPEFPTDINEVGLYKANIANANEWDSMYKTMMYPKSIRDIYKQFHLNPEGNPIENIRQTRAGSVMMALDKLRKKDVGVKNKGISMTSRYIQLPHWLSYKNSLYRDALNIQEKREENRNLNCKIFHEETSTYQSFVATKASDKVQLDLLDKVFVEQQIESGKSFSDNELRSRGLDARGVKSYHEVRAILDKIEQEWLTMREDSLFRTIHWEANFTPEEVADLRKIFDSNVRKDKPVDWSKHPGASGQFKAAVRTMRAGYGEIQQRRSEAGSLKNYFPLVRDQGDYYLSIYRYYPGEDGKEVRETVWSMQFPTENEAFQAKIILDKNMPFQGTEGNGRLVVGEPKKQNLEESETYFLVADMNLQRVINNAFGMMENQGKIDKELGASFRDAAASIITDTIRQKGASSHMMERNKLQWAESSVTLGFKTENLRQVLNNYIIGFYGMKAKYEASMNYVEMLKNVRSEDASLYNSLSSYASNMLRPATNLEMQAGTIKSFAFNFYLGAKISAAAMQLTQNFITGVPFLNREYKNWKTDSSGKVIGSAWTMKGEKYTLSAFKDAGKVINALFYKRKLDFLSPQEQVLIQRLWDTGSAQAQYVNSILRQPNTKSGKYWDLTKRFLGVFFGKAEEFNRIVASLSFIRMHNQELGGMSKFGNIEAQSDAVKTFIYDTHYLMTKANLPAFAQDKGIMGTFANAAMTFKRFQYNYFNSMYMSMFNSGSTMQLDVVMRSMAYFALFGGLMALPWLDDLFDLYERLSGKPIRAQVKRAAGEMGGKPMEKIVMSGMPGLLGFDMKGAIKLGLPGGLGESALGVWKGMYDNFVKGMTSAKVGDFDRAVEFMAPVFIQNAMKAYRIRSEGARTPEGFVQFDKEGKPFKFTFGEFLTQAHGFKPSRFAELTEGHRIFKNVATSWQDKRNRIFTENRFAVTSDEIAKVEKEAQDFNLKTQSVREYIAAISITKMRANRLKALTTAEKKEQAFYRQEKY